VVKEAERRSAIVRIITNRSKNCQTAGFFVVGLDREGFEMVNDDLLSELVEMFVALLLAGSFHDKSFGKGVFSGNSLITN
jgi:hypothetical protein